MTAACNTWVQTTGPIAHGEVLELLIGFKSALGESTVARLLSQLFANTKLSRKRFAKHLARLLREAGEKGVLLPVLLFSKLNKMFFGYFDPENILIDNK